MEKRQFRVYKNPQKCVSSNFQLQTIIKKNPKTLRGLHYQENHYNSTDSPNFSSLANLLKNNKSISSVYVNLRNSNLCRSQKILLALKNIKSLSKLTLYLPENEPIVQKIYHTFIICTKSLKRLTSLCSPLLNSKKVASPRRALYHLTPFRLLSKMDLELFFVNWLTDMTWRSFSYHLPSFRMLKSLQICYDFGNGFTQKNAFYLFSALKNLPLLTALNLIPIGCISVLRFIFENLKDLLHLQDLSLCLGSCRKPESDNKNFLFTGLALLNPSSFRRLALEFYKGFSDSDFCTLLSIIKRFSALKHLSLWFSHGHRVTSKGFSDFPATLSQFPALKVLDLSINSAKDTGSFFKIIGSCLVNLKELISFTIDTTSITTVDNLEVEYLCSQLSHLSKLESLHLAFESGSRLDEKCIESIAQALRNLTGLRSLYLDWKNDEKVTEKTYENLIESIGHLKRLGKLTIDGPLSVKKEILEAFGASLKILEKLHNLFFSSEVDCEEEYEEEGDFHERETEESYCDDFIELLENMEVLTDVVLYFEGFRFSKKSKDIVAKSLKNFRLQS